jgi:hypothetical protein
LQAFGELSIMARFEWTDLITDQLLDVYRSVRHDQAGGGNLRPVDYSHIAKELNEKLGKAAGTESAINSTTCKNKIENLKRKYQKELNNYKVSLIPSTWMWYDRISELVAGMHRYSGLPGGVDDGIFVNEPENPSIINEVDEERDESGDEDAIRVPLVPPVRAPEPPLVPPVHAPEPPLVPPVRAPEPRTVSPRSEMCSQAGVSGQINRRRKRSVADEGSIAMVRAIDRMNDTWSEIENKKLALFTRFLDARIS